jgi:3-oxoacyl-[acyl-carrier protein] reductase
MPPDRWVVVTGGSRGLGLGVVNDLLSNGYRVATCSRTSSDNLEKLRADTPPERLFWHTCELGREDQETAYFEKALGWGGEDSFYGLINNSAVAGEGILATFPNLDTERILNVNLLSAIRLTRLAVRPLLRHSRGGRIINISSIVGIRGYTGLAAYSASKAGLDGLTRSTAREMGRRNITVNSIAPGYFDSALSSTLGPAQRRQIITRTPLGRLADVGDIVPVVRFLLSPGGGFITGQTIVVDGGITC